MITIRCSVYEKYDFFNVLDYAKEKYYEDYAKDKITKKYLELELKKIEALRQRVKGNAREDYQQSSVKYNREHGTLKEREKDDLPKAPFTRT